MNSQKETENIRFRSDTIVERFDGYRDKWDDFYPSERWALQRLADQRQGQLGQVLDVGCAAGGLGIALTSRFIVDSYTGIDINSQAIALARQNPERFRAPATFFSEDVLLVDGLGKGAFDVVTSLSCADWNIATTRITNRCWEHVAPGGCFVMSVRLTNKEGINDLAESYQPIAWDNNGAVLESANYVVFNWQAYLALCGALKPIPSKVSGYGYWGKPAGDAVTPYQRLVFAVFLIQKPETTVVEGDPMPVEFQVPLDLLIT